MPITIKKAIEIKENHYRLHSDEFYRELAEADMLSIEALKAYQKSKVNGWYPPGYKLPGETEEGKEGVRR